MAIPYTENEVSSFRAPVNVILPLFRQFLKLEFSSPQEIPAKQPGSASVTLISALTLLVQSVKSQDCALSTIPAPPIVAFPDTVILENLHFSA